MTDGIAQAFQRLVAENKELLKTLEANQNQMEQLANYLLSTEIQSTNNVVQNSAASSRASSNAPPANSAFGRQGSERLRLDEPSLARHDSAMEKASRASQQQGGSQQQSASGSGGATQRVSNNDAPSRFSRERDDVASPQRVTRWDEVAFRERGGDHVLRRSVVRQVQNRPASPGDSMKPNFSQSTDPTAVGTPPAPSRTSQYPPPPPRPATNAPEHQGSRYPGRRRAGSVSALEARKEFYAPGEKWYMRGNGGSQA